MLRCDVPFARHLSSAFLALVVALGLPVQAAAQFTLTGRLLEQLPGGGTPERPYFLLLQLVDSTGDKSSSVAFHPCEAPATANCIQSNGTFTLLNFQPGLYLVRFVTFDNGTHVDRLFNVSISGNTDIGIVPLMRAPFALDMSLGQIPSSGGPIPLTVRAQTRWDVPTLALTAQLWRWQEDVNGQTNAVPSFIDFTWPAGLADSGVVALPPINVRSSVPAGAESCAEMVIVLRNQPDLILGQRTACRSKQP